MRGENGLTHEHVLARAKELAHHAFVRLGAITHFSFVDDAILLLSHCTGLGDHGFIWIKLHLNNLRGIFKNLVINYVAAYKSVSPRIFNTKRSLRR